MDTMHPSDGARFLLVQDQGSSQQDSVNYKASIYTPSDRFDYQVSLSLEGMSKLNPGERTADPHLERKLGTIARIVARDAARRHSQGIAPWPARILRWREG